MDFDLNTLIDMAKLTAVPTKLESTETHATYAVQPGIDLKSVDLETGHPHPKRKRGRVQVFDAASFNAVIAENDDAGSIAIYINRDASAPKIIAVLNGNGDTGPGWADFRAEIVFRFTPQWQRWAAIDGKMLSQVEFAEFIEDNLADIVTPAGAEMLEIAQYLSATRSTDFKSANRLRDGRVQFQNIENIEAKVGAGETEVPETITIGIAPVFGLPPYRMEARFRYRITNGKLTLGVKLQRIEATMEAVVNDMVNGVPQSETRMATPGIAVPEGAIMVDGIAPEVTK